MGDLTDASGASITIFGHDLADELIPSWTFAEVLHLLWFGSRPDEAHERMINAILVTVAEHGLTPSATTARLTLLGSPESPQAAVAAGLLGAGDAYLGTAEQAAEVLRDLSSHDDPDAAAVRLVEMSVATNNPIPGFGHPIHGEADPRSRALAQLQTELSLGTQHMDLAGRVAAELSQVKGRPIPLNAAGAIGAVVCDLGYPPVVGRALAIVARSAGLMAHVMSEQRSPLAPEMWSALRTVKGADDGD